MATPDPELTSKQEPINLNIIKFVSIDKAQGCPQCGAVTGTSGSGLTVCPFCTSKLLPQESAVAESQAARSNLNHCQTSPEVLQNFPGLHIIANNNVDAYEMLRRIDQYNTNDQIETLTDRKILPDQIPFARQEVAQTLAQRQSLMSSIIALSDTTLSIIQGTDNYGTKTPQILLSIAHPDKTYTLLRASSRPYPPRSPEAHDCVYLELTKLNRTPDSPEQLIDICTNKIYRESSDNNIIIADASLNYDTEDLQTNPIFKDKQTTQRYQEIITNAPTEKYLAAKYWEKVVDQLTPQEMKDLVVVQEVWFGRALREKIHTVSQQSDINPTTTPRISAETAAKFDAQYYIDKSEVDIGHVETANNFACGSCGSVLESYHQGEAFAACGSCHEINDVVATGRISQETLSARKFTDTAVPLEHVLSLVAHTAAEDAKSPDVLDINLDTFISAFTRETLPLEDQEDSSEAFELINGILKVATEYPHLMSRMNREGDVEASVCISITVPDKPEVMFKTDTGFRTMSVPQSLRGNIISFQFGDFDAARYSGNHGWCKFKPIVFTPNEIAQITTVQELDDTFDTLNADRGKSAHWLNHVVIGGLNIGATTNNRQGSHLEKYSGLYYELTRDLLAKVPRGNELNTILSTKQ